jgi:uncharacterized protein (DUF2236 family)
VVFGSTAAARHEIARLKALHAGIRGPVRDTTVRLLHGPAYAARDPELSTWVHATLVDSTIVAYDAWIRPYGRDERARFYAETRPIGRALGIPDRILPRDIDAFEAYLDRMLAPTGPIQVSPTARDLGHAVLNPPLGPIVPVLAWLPPAFYAWTMWPAVGLLPARVRDGFGLPWGARERLVSAWLVRGWRAIRPLVPTELRWMPHALAADRRMAGGEAGRR